MSVSKPGTYSLPILPYCLLHGVPYQPAEVKEGNEEKPHKEISCPLCSYDEIIHGRNRASIRILVTDEEMAQILPIWERMKAEGLPGVDPFAPNPLTS